MSIRAILIPFGVLHAGSVLLLQSTGVTNISLPEGQGKGGLEVEKLW